MRQTSPAAHPATPSVSLGEAGLNESGSWAVPAELERDALAASGKLGYPEAGSARSKSSNRTTTTTPLARAPALVLHQTSQYRGFFLDDPLPPVLHLQRPRYFERLLQKPRPRPPAAEPKKDCPLPDFLRSGYDLLLC